MLGGAIKDATNEQVKNELYSTLLGDLYRGVLRVGEPTGVRQLEAGPSAGGDGTRDRDLELYPGPQRSGRPSSHRWTRAGVRLAPGSLRAVLRLRAEGYGHDQ
jgi:hypothetical protein